MKEISKRVHTDSSFKAGYEQSQIRALYFNQLDPPVHICKEIILTIPEVFYTKKDFYLLDELNKKINMLKTSGLINFWGSENFKQTKLNSKGQKQPKVLTLNQLKGSFYILLIGFVSSFLCFSFEYMNKIKNWNF